MKMNNVVLPPSCIISITCNASHKGCGYNLNTSHRSNFVSQDCHILPFADVEAEEHIKHVINKEEEGIENDKNSHGASTHGSILNVLITLWTLK